MKGLTFDRLASFLDPIDLVTFNGYRSTPATMACGYGRSLVPSSYCLTTTTCGGGMKSGVSVINGPDVGKKERSLRDDGCG